LGTFSSPVAVLEPRERILDDPPTLLFAVEEEGEVDKFVVLTAVGADVGDFTFEENEAVAALNKVAFANAAAR